MRYHDPAMPRDMAAWSLPGENEGISQAVVRWC